jgi:hypothetical protein
MLLTNFYRLCCLRCIQAGYVSCATCSQNPDHGGVDSSDVQSLLDLDYPTDKEPISVSNLWSGWRKYQLPSPRDNHRADDGETYQCHNSYIYRSVDITEYTLDGKPFLQMTSWLTFDFQERPFRRGSQLRQVEWQWQRFTMRAICKRMPSKLDLYL